MDVKEKRHLDRRKQIEQSVIPENRSRIIMVNAAVILGVVVIAMVIQLVSLDQLGGQKDNLQRSKASAEATSSPKPQAVPSSTTKKKNKRIRKNLDTNKPMVAFTFDDGPYDAVTKQIVNVLVKNKSRATFFVVGNRIERYQEALKYAYEHGNQIGTHTYDHGDLSKMKKHQILQEISQSKNAIREVIGEDPGLLRPPYGTVNNKIRKLVGLPMIYWSVDSRDWQSRNKKQILEQCKGIQDGDIILMHDLYPTTADAVKKLIPSLVKKGYQLVTIEELFYYKGISLEAGQEYHSAR